MDKLKRLRWIPMLVRAYSDARERQEQSRQQEEAQPLLSALAPASEAAAKTPNRRVPVRVQRMQNRPRLTPKRPRQEMNSQSAQGLQSVLKELRATRKQMNRLDSLQSQLTKLQTQLDSQMGELFERLEEQKPHKQESPVRNSPPQ